MRTALLFCLGCRGARQGLTEIKRDFVVFGRHDGSMAAKLIATRNEEGKKREKSGERGWSLGRRRGWMYRCLAQVRVERDVRARRWWRSWTAKQINRAGKGSSS